MKYKLGDVLVSRGAIGVVTSITQTDEKYDVVTGASSVGDLVTVYSLGLGKSYNVKESDILGKLEIVK